MAVDPDRLYREHLPFVLRILTRGISFRHDAGHGFVRISSPFDAEDLAQDVFTAFFEQCERGNFDASRNVRAYLRGIAVRVAARHLGRNERHLLVEDLDHAPASPADDRLENEEAARLLAEFLDVLDARERAVFDGYFQERIGPQSAVGDALGLSRDQVARAITSIRKKCWRYFRSKGWLG